MARVPESPLRRAGWSFGLQPGLALTITGLCRVNQKVEDILSLPLSHPPSSSLSVSF